MLVVRIVNYLECLKHCFCCYADVTAELLVQWEHRFSAKFQLT